MKRTLLAVGVAVLISLMLVPRGVFHETHMWLPFFMDTAWLPLPVSWGAYSWEIRWSPFILQTVFLAVLAAVVVNIPWRRDGKKP